MRQPQLLKHDDPEKNTLDISSCRDSNSARSKLSEIIEQSSEPTKAQKKGPANVCNIKALLATLRKSSEFVFYYLVWAAPKRSEFYTPYCLRYGTKSILAHQDQVPT